MRKKAAVLFLGAALTVSMLGACGGNDASSSSSSASAVSTSSVSASSSSVQDESQTETESTSTSSSSAESTSTESTEGETSEAQREDGVYLADFNTGSNMFHANPDKNDGKGILTVKDGKMTIHVVLNSKNIVNLFLGTSEEAQQDGAELLEPVAETVDYSDGTSEEVYAFDIPIPGIDEEFPMALIGTKQKWWDHTVSVTNPVPMEE